MHDFLNNQVKVTRVENAATADTSTLTTDVVDMQGFDGCAFLASLGDVTASSVISLKVYETDTNAASGGDLILTVGPSTAGATDMDNKDLIGEVKKPSKRYLYAELLRGDQNAVVNGIHALQYGAKSLPVAQGSSVFSVGEALTPAAA